VGKVTRGHGECTTGSEARKNIFGSQVSVDRISGSGLLVRVRARVLNLYLVLNT